MIGTSHRHSLKLAFSSAWLIFLGSAVAQTPPDFIYEGNHVANGSNSSSAAQITSLSDSGSWTSGVCSFNESSSAGASGGTLTLSSSVTAERTSGSGVCEYSGGYRFSLWAKHGGDVYLSGSGTASYNISAPVSSSVSYGGYMYNAGTFSATKLSTGISENGSTSRSGNSSVHLGCSPGNTKSFGGVTYYKVAPSSTYTVTSYARTDGSGVGTTTITGNQTITAAFGANSPVVVLDVQQNCSQGLDTSFANFSYDPDNPTSPPPNSRNTCSAAWSVSGPSSYGFSSSSNASVSFNPPHAGTYTASLTVTDDEGSTSNTSADMFCRPKTPSRAGTDATDSGSISHQCGGAGNGGDGGAGGASFMSMASAEPAQRGSMSATGSVTPATGNATVSVSVSSQAGRGSGIPLEIQLHSHRIVGGAYFTSMMNGNFTYSIGFMTSGSSRYFVDADGSEFYVGTTSGSPTPPAGFYGTFTSITGGYKLQNAGAPGEIWQAGSWTYEFNGPGSGLTKITDPVGNIRQITWALKSGQNHPVEIEEVSTGRTVTLTYDTYPRIIQITEDSSGNYTTISYNGNAKISSIQRKNNSGTVIEKVDVTYFTASGQQHLLKDVEKDGDTTSKLSFTYLPQGAVSGQTTYLANMTWPGGNANVNYFASPGSGASYRTQVTNSLGGVTKHDYDSSGRLVRTILPVMSGASAGVSYTFQYDSNHNITQISDGATTTDFTYNSKGKVTEIDDNNGGVWTFTYAGNGVDLTEVEDSIGSLVQLVYGDVAQPHLRTSVTDGDGNTWTKTYNAYGQLLTVAPPSGSPTGTTTYEYEETSSSPNFGFLKKITNGAGNETRFTSYNGAGQVTEIEQTPESGTDIAFQFAYDGGGRTTRETLPDGKYRDYAYSYRKLAFITDEAGAVTSFDFCAVCGKLTGVDMPLSKSLAWDQDADHRTTAFIDARSKETEYEYGLAGELKKTLYPDGSYLLYRYDDYGRLAETEDTRGHKKQYTYDGSGRVEEIDLVPASGTPTSISYTFRTDGRVSAVTDEVGTTTYSYTSGRRVSAVEYDWSVSGLTNAQTLEYDYNPDGTLHALEWKNGTSSVADWEYDYDGAGRLTEVVNSFGETTTFTYDGVGKLKTQANENGTSTTYTYNQNRGWPTQILHKLGTTPFASYDLEYDGGNNTVGNVTKVTELDSSEVEYTYDALYRLTAEDRTGTGAYTRSYGYDLAGNMTTYGGSTFASYDDANKISSLSGGSASYDADANMIAVSGAGIPNTTLTWDVRNRLKRQQTSTDDLTYGYDASGKRVLRHPTGSGSLKRFFVFSGRVLLGEVDTGAPSAATTWGAYGIVSQRLFGIGDSRWYHFGPQAETRFLTDATGAVIDGYRYDGYGWELYSSGVTPNPFKYGGRDGYYRDGDSKLVLATHRWYSPNLSRWISADPIGYAGGDNMHAYAIANPISHVDPDGLEVQQVEGGGYGASGTSSPSVSVSDLIPFPPDAGVIGAAAAGYSIGSVIEELFHDEIQEALFGPEEPAQCSFDPQLEMGPRRTRNSRCRDACDLANSGYFVEAQRVFCDTLKTSEEREVCRARMADAIGGPEDRQTCYGYCDGSFPPKKRRYIH
ncbi:hypothetical protein J0H58_12055 [bacterium]|nr:hypothetical protein [bacterium]